MFQGKCCNHYKTVLALIMHQSIKCPAGGGVVGIRQGYRNMFVMVENFPAIAGVTYYIVNI